MRTLGAVIRSSKAAHEHTTDAKVPQQCREHNTRNTINTTINAMGGPSAITFMLRHFQTTRRFDFTGRMWFRRFLPTPPGLRLVSLTSTQMCQPPGRMWFRSFLPTTPGLRFCQVDEHPGWAPFLNTPREKWLRRFLPTILGPRSCQVDNHSRWIL